MDVRISPVWWLLWIIWWYKSQLSLQTHKLKYSSYYSIQKNLHTFTLVTVATEVVWLLLKCKIYLWFKFCYKITCLDFEKQWNEGNNPLGHLLLILCFRSKKIPMTMRAGSSLFIITTYTFNEQKDAVGRSFLAICHGNKVVLVLRQWTITLTIRLEAIVSQHEPWITIFINLL